MATMNTGMTAEGWALIITAMGTAIGLIVTKILEMILAYRREKDKILREEAASRKVEQVRQDLALNTTKTVAAESKLETMVTELKEIKKTTNGMKDELVEAARSAGLAEGERIGREKGPRR